MLGLNGVLGTGPGFFEACLIGGGGGGGGGGGIFGAEVSGLLPVEVLFIDGARVMAFSGFFSSVGEDIGTFLPCSSLDLNEPKDMHTSSLYL